MPRLTQPRVPAASVATRLRDTVSNLFLQLDKRVDERDGLEDVCVDVVVGWHKPPSTSERTSRASSPDRYSSSQASHPKSYAAFQSPYSWLASALAGSRTPSRGESRERDGAHVLVRDTGHDGIDSDTFEQWVLSLRVHCGSGVPRDALAAALTDFTWTAMAFAGEHQAELPAIVDAGLVPFPYTIDGSIRA